MYPSEHPTQPPVRLMAAAKCSVPTCDSRLVAGTLADCKGERFGFCAPHLREYEAGGYRR